MRGERVAIIGAGIGGLTCGLGLAARGIGVVIVEKSAEPGGKMRRVAIEGRQIDCGPTVLTMRPVFEEIFAAAGSSLTSHLTLRPAEILARHAWSEHERLDLFSDIDRSADAIARFSSPQEAKGYVEFCARARRIYDSLDAPFIRSARPSLNGLIGAFGLRRLGDLWQISPFVSLWAALGEHFKDPRLRQLFGRYATYCGSSPFSAPATLMLVAHVEREGVWLVDGGMHRLAQALAALAKKAGAELRYRAEASSVIVERGRARGVTLASGERIDADAVVVNADPSALGAGCFGASATAASPPMPRGARSLSAITWAMVSSTDGFPLVRHNVFFSSDYAGEFEHLRHGKLPLHPTVYVCAQDRDGAETRRNPSTAAEALFCLVNAPASGDTNSIEPAEINQCKERTFALLRRYGLRLERQSKTVTTTPRDFERLFPATGGALYGQASHGWMASFRRPGSRTRIPGLYLVGGSTHPGPGVPMAAISGRLAARAVVDDFASIRRFHRAAMSGGTSTR